MENLWYRECQTGRRFIIKIDPGTKITAALLDFARSENIQFASMVSALGSVRNVEFTGIQAGAHLPMTGPRIKIHKLEGPLELLGLEGNIAPNAEKQLGGQFYILGAKSSGEVVGGRLVEAEVFATCEIVLAEYLVDGIERHYSASSGVDTLYIEEKK
ncbi:MAG: DNA-binding protein [Holophaga sp.]|nr:DNA-binding protein [Holophaga sp.]